MTRCHQRLSATFSLTLALSLIAGPVCADVVAVVSARSKVVALTQVQVADIFLGRASRFPDGSPALPIDLAEDSAARNDFYERLAGKSPAQVKAYWSKIIFTGRGRPPMSVSTSSEMKKRVLENPSAIGYLDSKLVDASVRIIF